VNLPPHLKPPSSSLNTQDPIYQPNHYLGLMEFREQTLQRLKRFCDQRFFSVKDYTRGEIAGIIRLIKNTHEQHLTLLRMHAPLLPGP